MQNENLQIPEAKPKSSPKDVFMHLLMIAMLYVGAFSFISLWFNYINFLFPDPLNFYYVEINQGVLIATATLFVVFPVYFLLSWLLGKEMIAEPEKRELVVRKWLVYLTLFIAAVAIIVDTVVLMYFFLNGESTARFFLKVAAVLVTAAFVFGYYIWDVKRKAGMKSNLPKMLASAAALVLVGSISYGFFLFGSPAHQRDLRMDDQRVNDLRSIQDSILNYWQQKGTLPSKLSELADSIKGFVPPVDPETGAQYEYNIASETPSFKLCTIFKAKSVPNSRSPYVNYSLPVFEPVSDPSETWDHEVGHVCFPRTIDPELYKLNKPIPVVIQ